MQECFKNYFSDEYHELKEQKWVTSYRSIYQANYVIQGVTAPIYIASAFDNLALSDTTDHDVVQQLLASKKLLIETNNKLSAQLETAISSFPHLPNRLICSTIIPP